MTADDLSMAAGPATSERWELAYQWRMLWRTLKYSVLGVLVFLTLLAVGQIYIFHQMFASVHPFLGWAFIAAVTAIFIWLIALPLARFLHAPKISHPPDVNLKDPAIDHGALASRLHFDAAYLKNMCANPALSNQRKEALKARDDLSLLADSGDENLAAQLAAFEADRIAVLLKDLDKQVDDYIHREALTVGSTTAVSMNGSIDAFIVLWRNINMISRISRLYYGRPSMRISLQVLRDVMMAVLLSRTLDDVSDMAGDALGKTVSRLGGMVAGPVLDGSVNALVTLKLGYLAKKRCRSFDVWSKSSAQTAVKEAFERVSQESSSLIGELVKMTGAVLSAAAKATGAVAGFATDAAGNVIAVPKSAWSLVQDAFMRKQKPDDQES